MSSLVKRNAVKIINQLQIATLAESDERPRDVLGAVANIEAFLEQIRIDLITSVERHES